MVVCRFKNWMEANFLLKKKRKKKWWRWWMMYHVVECTIDYSFNKRFFFFPLRQRTSWILKKIWNSYSSLLVYKKRSNSIMLAWQVNYLMKEKKNAWTWEPINVYGRCVIGWNKFGPAMSAFRREGSSVRIFCQLSKSEPKEISIPTSKIWSKRDLITVGPHWFWWFEERHVHLLDEYGWDRVRILFWSRNTIHDAVLMMTMMITKLYTSYDSHF